MLRKLLMLLKFFGRRKNGVYLPLLVAASSALVVCWWCAQAGARALLPPPPPDQTLDHFRRTRSLQHYLDHIQVLIEPSSVPCGREEVPVIVMVTSVPAHAEHREAIRSTWGKHQPTYFVLGLDGYDVDDSLVDNYVEAKLYSDMIVFDLHDHYQNLTLKTALMLQWTRARCPQASFMFKTDDDVLLNPWTLRTVLKDHADAKLIGYRMNDTSVHRDEYTKWFLPRWLYAPDHISEYLSGTGYLINGQYLSEIFQRALELPLINIEDVYFTHIVAKEGLGLELTHDKRLSPYKPWVPQPCAYWHLASAHSLKPSEMLKIWPKILRLSKEYETNKDVCSFFDNHVFSDWLLY